MKPSDKLGISHYITITIALMVIVFTFFLIIVGEKGISDLKRSQNEKESMVQANAALKRKNADILHEIERLKNDPWYVEVIARHELGLIGKNEIVIIMNDVASGTEKK